LQKRRRDDDENNIFGRRMSKSEGKCPKGRGVFGGETVGSITGVIAGTLAGWEHD